MLHGAGHFGLVVGGAAARVTWPAVAAWVRSCDDGVALPEAIHPLDEGAPHLGPRAGTRLGVGLDLAAGVAAGAARSGLRTAAAAASLTRSFGRQATRQVPRLARIERMQPQTRISAGLLLDERARRTPAAVALAFADRAFTHGAVKERVDGVVRGLLAAGVTRGEHVGVLIRTRASALVAVLALNRLGAVAVLLRRDGELERELELGGCGRVLADPELAPEAARAGAATVLALGGATPARSPQAELVDLGELDPRTVQPPDWYRPNPGRAADPAFVLFSGRGDRTRLDLVTNGRWALAAFGTASSAALSERDTVYAVTPLDHPVGLLVSVGGAIAGGARLALAAGFDPDTYWQEVRRYGATVACYSSAMLRALVERPADPAERHHPLRLFLGSGMPRGLWRRVEQRFSPARVLELYTSSRGEAFLANVAGAKRGCAGRPLPGSAELRIAAPDERDGALLTGADGFALPCGEGELGMLLARERPGVAVSSTAPLHDVFERGDAWLATGDLFQRDRDGDFWPGGSVRSLVATADGPVAPLPIAEALGDLVAVDVAVAYGVHPRGAPAELAIAALTVRAGSSVDEHAIERALSVLPRASRPAVVHVVRAIELTTWSRPRTEALRRRGLPRPGPRAWARAGDARRRADGGVVRDAARPMIARPTWTGGSPTRPERLGARPGHARGPRATRPVPVAGSVTEPR